MKFKVKISLKDKLPNEYELEGDLDAIKVFIKLKIVLGTFEWASITRIDEEMSQGDVQYWSVQHDRRDGNLVVNAFGFYEMDEELNLNAMRRALNDDDNRLFPELGEGTI